VCIYTGPFLLENNMADEFISIPDTTDIAALEAAMNANARASSEFGGANINLYPGDVTLAGGSATDANGNVYTLDPVSSQLGSVFDGVPMGVVNINGTQMDALGGGGFVDAIRVVNGTAEFENAKGHGWFTTETFVGSDDPGPGDPGSSQGGLSGLNSSPQDQAPPPVDQTPPPVDEQTPPPPDDQTPPPSNEQTPAPSDDQNASPPDDQQVAPAPADDQTSPSPDDSTPPSSDDGGQVPPEQVHAGHHGHMHFHHQQAPADDSSSPAAPTDMTAPPPVLPAFNPSDFMSELFAALHLGIEDDGNGGTLITFGHHGSVDLPDASVADVKALAHMS
jgi:hypothetical protein